MPVFEIAGARVTLAVCFDVHFLAAEASDLLRSVDVLLFASAWVDEGPEDGRAPILAELARSHGVTVANANWGVGAPLVGGQGGSRFVWPDGTSLRVPEGATRIDAIVAGRGAR
jgi:predicted amidohydrolase